MNRTLLITLAIALLTPFAAIADPDDLGTPDLECQNDLEKDTHDYGPPAGGNLIFNPQDGNLQSGEDCPESTWFDHDSQECTDLEANPEAHQALCHDPRPAPYDGDLEYANGGGWLIASNGNGVTNGGPVCWGTEEHHTPMGSIYVTDAVFPDVVFIVAADFTDPLSPVPPGEVDCGDGIIQPCSPPPPPTGDPVIDLINALLHDLFNTEGATCTPGDSSKTCLNRCRPDFGPGVDGSYAVFVGSYQATQGHIYSP